MLEITTQKKILELTDGYWGKHVCESTFARLVSGKEPGHRMADYVDDKTVSLLKIEFDTRYEANARGQIKRRSVGDVWIHSSGMYNPVNVKSGEQLKNGQPNLVSMQKLLDYIFKRWIDSYYLLIVKFRLGSSIEHKTYLVDLLDWLDYVAFDAGPGQIMLREADFYDAHEQGIQPETLSITSKAEKLFSLFEKGMQNLFANREKRLQRQRGLFQTFSAAGDLTIDQSKMTFVP
ncbi:MAG: hypothetical protein KKE86_14990 [Planctomycetes bacterium]|nr:hypothetical protein [Planctomycetota bacterium]MBU4400626.1 hypothetical protein [Planctomycetota bacterium]MCG2685335.1 hypothetical protein [Planctomycetales bacterium]